MANNKVNSSKMTVQISIDHLMNIKNLLGALSLYCDNKQFAEDAQYYRNVCQQYIDNFEKQLEDN